MQAARSRLRLRGPHAKVVLLNTATTTPATTNTPTTVAMIQASRRRCLVAALMPTPMPTRIAIVYNEIPSVSAAGEMAHSPLVELD